MRDHDSRLRRLERGAMAGLTVLGSLLLMGQVLPRQRAVEGESFVLRDARGTIRAVLGMQEGDTVALTLKSAAGRDHIALLVRADGSTMVRALDRGGRAGVELGSRADGTGLTVLDRGGRTRAAVAVAADGHAGVVLGESSRKDRVRLSLAPDGTSGLRFLDVGGRERTTLELAVDGTARLDLTDPSGRPRAALAVAGGGSPTLVLRDDAGNPTFEAPSVR